MKISDAYGKVNAQTISSTGSAQKAGKVGGGQSSAVQQRAKDDAAKVNVSAEAKKLEAASSGNAEKIERLKGAISNGSFKVDAQKIADTLAGVGDE